MADEKAAAFLSENSATLTKWSTSRFKTSVTTILKIWGRRNGVSLLHTYIRRLLVGHQAVEHGSSDNVIM